jgi:hypothetical protein
MTIAAHPSDLGGPAGMTTTLRVATVHNEVSLPIRLALLDAIDGVLRDHGVSRIWIDPDCRPDAVVLAEAPPG